MRARLSTSPGSADIGRGEMLRKLWRVVMILVLLGGAEVGRAQTALLGNESSSSSSYIVSDDGRLYTWGRNNGGQLGIGSTVDRTTRQPVGFPTGVTAWTAIAGGSSHTLAVGSDGKLYAWGDNMYGQLGNGNTSRRTTFRQA